MNERIRELASEVGISVDYLTNTKQIELLEKFAELIVRECDQYVAERFDEYEPRMNPGDLLKHFGVEE